MSIDSAIAWDVFKSVVAPIKRQFGYVIYSKRHAQDLQKEVEELVDEVDRVHNVAEEARNNLRNVYGRVTEWHASAEKALKEARDLLRDFQEASKTCCYETLPDPKCRYQFSRKAKDKIEVIQRLTQRSSGFKELNDISSSNPAPGNVAALPPAKDNGVFESRASIIRDIMDALADDSNSVVGVYGMGGVGKSTLLADVKGRMIEKKSFDWVAKADVSENPDIKKIQGEIAHALGLDIKNEEIVSVRAELLHKRLENEEREKKKVLIILDNLWKVLNLKSVGIPCGHDNKVIGCKLLLTSRFQDVLGREMGCDRDFRLEELKDEEAKTLFERTVGDKVHNEPFKSLVDEAVQKCAGLPFLITAMANNLKDADIYEWKDALRQIEKSTNKGISESINKMLQLSYDRFKEEVKSLLRLCVVYGVSKPSFENLVRYCVGLRLFREDSSVEEVRNRLRSLIQTLKASSFLLVDDEDVDGFKIHDLVRGFVAGIASRDHHILVLGDNDKSVIELPKDKLKSCRAACFPFVDIKELPKMLDCPVMQIFLLFTNDRSLEVPDSYFNYMRNLMVLHLSQVHLTRSPSPFRFLENLHTLCLNGCLMEDVAMIGELKGLHILSFVNSKIRRLPKEIGQLVELRLLDLNHCSQLKIIEPGVFGSLIKLEELYMENSFDRWNAMEQNQPTNAKLIELNNLKNLCTLHVSILDPSGLPEDLNVEKLTKYKIKIGDVMCWRDRKGSSILELKLYSIGNILHKGIVQTFLGKSDDLFLDGLNGIEQSICELSQEGFPKLKHLHVENSPSVHHVLQSPSPTNFRKLESLLLKNLINFEKICNYSISSKSFSALKVIQVESCDKMEILFPLSLLRELPQLEEIRVANCPLVREIAKVDDRGKVELRNLHVLELLDLPNIKNFFTSGTAPSSSTSNVQVGTQIAFFNGQQVSIPSLKSLTMAGLPNLEELWTDESPLGLSNLQFLVVSSCKSLSKVINSRSLIKLQKLHTLTVGACISVQEIFDLDGAGVNVETLSELNTIFINRLPSLRCIWNKNPCGIVRFHNLKKLQVYDCDNLGFLFFPSMVQSLAQLRELEVRSCKNMEVIIMKEEGLRVEKLETLVFPMLTELNLEMLESLTCFSHRKCTQKAQGEDSVKLHSPIFFNQEVSIPSLESLTMAGLPNLENMWSDESPLELSNLQFLEVSLCKSLSKVIDSKSLVKLHKLHTLVVQSCVSVQEIFDLEELSANANIETLSGLNTIHLMELLGLRHIWNKNPCGIVRFHNLKEVRVGNCNNLRFMFFPSMVQCLAQLRELVVEDCKKMEAIIMEEEGSSIEISETLIFPMLTILRLICLESLTCFSCRKCTSEARGENRVKSRSTILFSQEVAFPSLETLEIRDMANIEIICDNQVAADSFHKLKSLELWRCSKLLNIVPPCIIGWLESLESLKVGSCDLLEVVFKLQPLNSLDGYPVAHLPLKRLELDGLPELKCVWDKELHNQVKVQLLRSVTVYRCKSLTSLFPASVAVDLTQLEELKIYECGIVELIEKEDRGVPRFVFPNLTSLKLQHLMELRCIYIGKYVSHWPALKTLEMCGCHKVETLASHPENDMPFDKQPLFLVEKVAFPSLETLEIRDMANIEIICDNQVDADSFHELKSLEVWRCSKLLNIFPSCILGWLKSLESLKVGSCDLLEVVFKLQPRKPLDGLLVAHLPLKRLELDGLPELKCVWDKELHNQVKAQLLHSVTVYRCKSLTFLFPASVAIDLTQLEELKIYECGIVELIEMEDKGVPRFVFPKLTSLKVQHLMELRCIYIGKYVSHWPALKTLEMCGCHKVEILVSHPENDMTFDKQPLLLVEKVGFPSLEALHISGMGSIKMIWDNHVTFSFPRCFQYLKTLDVSYCDELSNMFTPITIGNLVELTKLRISNCNKLTEVISNEGGKEGPVVAFKQLKYIQLEELRGLTCFSSGRHILMFPLLEDIIVTGCHNIKFFSEAPIRAPKLKKVQGSIGTWFCNGNINNTIQKMAMDDGVEFMHLYQAKGHSDLISIKPSRQLKSLVVDGCSFFNAIPSRLVGELDKINTLQVQDCEQLEEIFGLEILVAEKITQGLPQLCNLNLVNLPKLRQLCNKDFQGMLCFNSLSCLILYKCNNLRYAFTPSMGCLPMLQWMEIKECDQMEEVIREEKGERSAVEKITFPILRWIELECLPNMTAFPFRMNHALECPVLQELTIARCPKMIMFTWQSLIKIGQGISSPFTPQVIFPHLYSMVLSHMDGSSKIWVHSSQHSRKVEALDKLRVKFCVIKETGLPNVTSYATNQDLLPKLPSSEET